MSTNGVRAAIYPRVSRDDQTTHLSAGNGILKVAALVGVGSGTVQRVKREIVVGLTKPT